MFPQRSQRRQRDISVRNNLELQFLNEAKDTHDLEQNRDDDNLQ